MVNGNTATLLLSTVDKRNRHVQVFAMRYASSLHPVDLELEESSRRCIACVDYQMLAASLVGRVLRVMSKLAT